MDDVAEIKSRLEIAEVVGAYLPLKQAGRNLKAPCPFHQEKTASFMVSPDKGIYHCFGCNEGGDIFSFVMKMEGLDFRGALEKLARQAGVELSNNPVDQRQSQLKAKLLEAHELATKYFQATLMKNPKVLEYLAGRGLTKAAIKEFRLGYAPDSWEALNSFLQKRGFLAEDLVKGGLAGRRSSRQTVYDLFRGRVMFPINDRDGRPIGFTGRVLDDSQPKYLNTPQTPLYDKGAVLFGFDLAREVIRRQDEAVLVEGNMDVVASHQAGVKQVVASSGTALTLDQLKQLSKLTRNIKLAFDADRAGLAATERAIELGQQLGLTLRMITITGAKDPDELTRQNPKAWEEAIKNAQYVVDYLFERFEHEYDLSSAVGKRQYSDRLAATLARLADPVEQDHYVQLLATKLGIAPDAIRKKLENTDTKAATTDKPKRAVSQVRVEQIHDGRAEMEESLLSISLAYPTLRQCLDDLEISNFGTTERQTVFAALREHADAPGAVVALSLTELADYANILLLRGEELFGSLAPADRSLEAFQLARRLRTASNKDQKTVLSQRVREAEKTGDADLVRSLLEEYQTILTEEEV